jgi:putative nucleotidyltransferase with HDIG domain
MKKNKILLSLYKGINKVVKSLGLKERAEAVCKLCVEDLGLSLCWIGKKEKDGSVSVFAQYPFDHPYPKLIKVRWDESDYGKGPTGRAIKLGIPQILRDVETPEYKVWLPVAKKYGFKSSAAFPIKDEKGKIWGSLNLYSKKKNYFSSETIEIFNSFSELLGLTFKNAFLREQANRRLNKIVTLRNIDLAILSSLDIRVIYNVFLHEAVSSLQIDAISLLEFNEFTQEFKLKVQKGLSNEELKKQSIKIGSFIPGKAAKERRIIKASLKEMDEPLRKRIMEEQGFNIYYASPMIAKGKILGIVEVFRRNELEEEEIWVEFFEALTGQVSMALENAKLLFELQNAKEDLLLAYDQTIEALSYALDLRDKETKGHSRRVTELTVKIAEKFGIRGEKLRYVKWGALLHDIGKLGVPDSILLKPGPLTEEEWEIMKKHPEYGYNMLKKVDFLLPALEIPLYHHEKWDGSGYPKGLKGDEIPLPARIFAVVDAWDALTNERPYRPPWSKEKALEYIISQSGKHFDPEVVKVFLEVIKEYL